jgi:hypothetical protein
MVNKKLAKRLIDTLPYELPTLFNPWRDHCIEDKPCNRPDTKLARLAAHLDCDPEFILCGKPLVIAVVGTAELRLRANVFCWRGKFHAFLQWIKDLPVGRVHTPNHLPR